MHGNAAGYAKKNHTLVAYLYTGRQGGLHHINIKGVSNTDIAEDKQQARHAVCLLHCQSLKPQ